eukprot:6489559-Amphidinium_carterae.2
MGAVARRSWCLSVKRARKCKVPMRLKLAVENNRTAFKHHHFAQQNMSSSHSPITTCLQAFDSSSLQWLLASFSVDLGCALDSSVHVAEISKKGQVKGFVYWCP